MRVHVYMNIQWLDKSLLISNATSYMYVHIDQLYNMNYKAAPETRTSYRDNLACLCNSVSVRRRAFPNNSIAITVSKP